VANADADEAPLDSPEYSKSNTRTSESPAAVMTIRSLLCGMNFTEKMFWVCPVATVVASLN
jgi:hypothetical protein